MTIPRDTHVEDRIGMVRVARILSNIISPPVMFAAAGIALGVHERPFWPGLVWGLIYGVLVALGPLFVILYLMRTGHISELHMSSTRERHIPYISAVVFGMIAYALLLLFNGPELLRCLTILSAITLGTLGLINTRWLISIHATAAIITWLVVTLIFGWTASLTLLPLVVLICWVRIYLKRHTPAQVLAGIALGIATFMLIRILGCFPA